MKHRLLAAASAAVLGAATLASLAAPAHAAAPGNRHVVVFGVDGARWDKVQSLSLPTLDGLAATGYASPTWLYSSPLAQTLSGPGWSTNLTGTWPDKHKVVDNTFLLNALGTTPSFLNLVESNNGAFGTYAGVDWKPIGDNIIGSGLDREYVLNGDANGYPAEDTKIQTDAASYLRNNGPHASFVYFGEVDIAGHDSGGASTAYAQAMQSTDARIGAVIDAVKSRPTYAQEEWLFLVTADHGHTDAGGHGGDSKLERTSFVIANGPGVPVSSPSVKPKNVDVAATALDWLGVPRPANLDGQPITTASTDPFDAQWPLLAARQDETGIPATTLGWTKTFPSGWSVDNSAMGTGGMAEWRGWTLTDDEFWTATQTGQDRENNVRARGVFAVAESDEWADKTFSGTYTTTLVSPNVSVAGKTTLPISFVSHYLQEGGQRATVLVSFDGGADQQLLQYSANAKSRLVNLTATVPAGAQNAKIKFRLSNANNNWYWVVDAPVFG
ncbi:type I phosphodiesterase/nucleotide pyrophosphatase [Actinocorallia herbida]|uniref:Type I phosphodiesterase/nucleotide pyrophosphatase n=1 Tax=Actinocorallia herbida TaxID=58109 RepID=A0A3N1D3U4_9ACTN|nr:alkaline phosphatase family protein [Actinocorallia herbida]ROO88170.1 type I phosphodiesterase/nucleotide pyrophosphatase [Actinocorallia herbida]